MSNSSSAVQHAYLVLADISGYTSFVAGTELEHAQEILSDLLAVILARFKTLLHIHKLEGDAVFAYASHESVGRGETLIELLEATYVDFRERVKNVRRHTTCSCRACQSIPLLDLKFIVHFGDFVVQDVAGVRELAGSDVNLAHRLLKNHVADETGWHAYALFTAASLAHMGVRPEGMVESAESYEHLGESKICAMDLHARYDALMASRRVVVEPGEALIAFSQDFDAPPPVVWDWLNDPAKRSLISPDKVRRNFVPILLPGGRTGAGATTHCVHGQHVAMYETVLDWKPFDYYTVRQDSGRLGILRVTVQLRPSGAGKTHAEIRLTGEIPHLPAFLSRPLIVFFYTRGYNYAGIFESVNDMIRQSAAPVAAAEPRAAESAGEAGA